MAKGARPGPSLLSGLPGQSRDRLVCGRQAGAACGRRSAFSCQRSRRRLLSDRRGFAQGHDGFALPAASGFFLSSVPGAIVGELSMIDGLPRSAAVVAVRDANLSFLSRAAFEAFAQNHPEVYKTLVTLLAMRLRETDTVIAAGSFLPLKGRVASTLARTRRAISARTSARAASSSGRKSDRAISPPWPASRARMSAASSTNGSGASWSADCPAIIALRTRRSWSTKRSCDRLHS